LKYLCFNIGLIQFVSFSLLIVAPSGRAVSRREAFRNRDFVKTEGSNADGTMIAILIHPHTPARQGTRVTGRTEHRVNALPSNPGVGTRVDSHGTGPCPWIPRMTKVCRRDDVFIFVFVN
jgi:hypothetical protein